MLDSITWGNPSQKHLPYLEPDKSPLEKLIPQLIKFTFPKNSSKACREELNELVDCVDALKKDEQALKRYMAYDKSLTQVMAQVIIEQNLGEKGAEIVDKIIDETVPLIMKLKFYFQRPRPYHGRVLQAKTLPFLFKVSSFSFLSFWTCPSSEGNLPRFRQSLPR
jgi:hypothetical protein